MAPTRTTRWRLLARRGRRGARRPGRLRVQPQPGGAPHGRARPAPPARAWASWNVDQADCDPPGDGRHDDLPHEPAAVAARARPVLRVGQPGRQRPRRPGDPGPRDQPPAVHVPDARRPGGDPRAPGPPAHLVRGRPPRATASTRTAAAPASRPPSCSRSRPRAWRSDGAHEVAPARGQGPASPARPVRLRAGARRLLRRARPRRAGRGRPSLRLVGRNRRNVARVPRRRPPGPPATDIRDDVLAHLRAQGEDPTGWRITLVTNLRVLGYVFNPASFYLCRDRPACCGSSSSRSTTPTASGTCTPCAPRRPAASFTASMDKDFYVSPFIDMDGPVHGPRPGRARRACGSRSTSARTAQPRPRHQPRPRRAGA